MGGFAAAYLVFGRGKRETVPAPMAWIGRIANAGIVDRIYELGYRRVTLVFADALAWFDRYVVDGLINLLGYSTLEAGAAARPIQTGLATDYVTAVVVGAVCVAAWAVTR